MKSHRVPRLSVPQVHSSVQYCTRRYCNGWLSHCTVLYWGLMHCVVLYCTVWCSTGTRSWGWRSTTRRGRRCPRTSSRSSWLPALSGQPRMSMRQVGTHGGPQLLSPTLHPPSPFQICFRAPDSPTRPSLVQMFLAATCPSPPLAVWQPHALSPLFQMFLSPSLSDVSGSHRPGAALLLRPRGPPSPASLYSRVWARFIQDP